MPTYILIGAGAGLVSAALFASAATEAALGGILLFLSPLPLFLAGFGWGRSAALLAALGATVVIAGGLGPAAASLFALILAAPIVVLVHLTLLARPVAGLHGAPDGAVEWYPPGRLVACAALIAGALAGLFVLLFGFDQETYRQSIADSLNNPAFKELDPDGTLFTPETIENLTAVLAKALPGMLAVTWLTIVLLNLWLAGFIVEASGRALRPWPNLHALELPNMFVAVFAIAILVSLVPGVIGLLGTGLAGAMLFAYVLQGLAVIHVYSRGVPFRQLLLAAVYLGILLLGWVALLVAIVGLGEPLFGWRARASSQPPKDNKTD
jgi:hypothetical protein